MIYGGVKQKTKKIETLRLDAVANLEIVTQKHDTSMKIFPDDVTKENAGVSKIKITVTPKDEDAEIGRFQMKAKVYGLVFASLTVESSIVDGEEVYFNLPDPTSKEEYLQKFYSFEYPISDTLQMEVADSTIMYGASGLDRIQYFQVDNESAKTKAFMDEIMEFDSEEHDTEVDLNVSGDWLLEYDAIFIDSVEYRAEIKKTVGNSEIKDVIVGEFLIGSPVAFTKASAPAETFLVKNGRPMKSLANSVTEITVANLVTLPRFNFIDTVVSQGNLRGIMKNVGAPLYDRIEYAADRNFKNLGVIYGDDRNTISVTGVNAIEADGVTSITSACTIVESDNVANIEINKELIPNSVSDYYIIEVVTNTGKVYALGYKVGTIMPNLSTVVKAINTSRSGLVGYKLEADIMSNYRQRYGLSAALTDVANRLVEAVILASIKSLACHSGNILSLITCIVYTNLGVPNMIDVVYAIVMIGITSSIASISLNSHSMHRVRSVIMPAIGTILADLNEPGADPVRLYDELKYRLLGGGAMTGRIDLYPGGVRDMWDSNSMTEKLRQRLIGMRISMLNIVDGLFDDSSFYDAKASMQVDDIITELLDLGPRFTGENYYIPEDFAWSCYFFVAHGIHSGPMWVAYSGCRGVWNGYFNANILDQCWMYNSWLSEINIKQAKVVAGPESVHSLFTSQEGLRIGSALYTGKEYGSIKSKLSKLTRDHQIIAAGALYAASKLRGPSFAKTDGYGAGLAERFGGDTFTEYRASGHTEEQQDGSIKLIGEAGSTLKSVPKSESYGQFEFMTVKPFSKNGYYTVTHSPAYQNEG